MYERSRMRAVGNTFVYSVPWLCNPGHPGSIISFLKSLFEKLCHGSLENKVGISLSFPWLLSCSSLLGGHHCLLVHITGSEGSQSGKAVTYWHHYRYIIEGKKRNQNEDKSNESSYKIQLCNYMTFV